MHRSKHAQLTDTLLKQRLIAAIRNEFVSTAELLGYIAEFDARKLYLREGYASMLAYCVGGLGLAEDAARKRIHAARAARDYPEIFQAVAEGRLHLTGVVTLAPHLSPETAPGLLAASERKTRAEIEQLLASRFPRPDVPSRIRRLTAPEQRAPGRVELSPAPAQVVVNAVPARVAPIAPARYALQVTLDGSTHEKLRQAQALLSHRIPSGDLAQVLDHVLATAIAQYEKRKFAASEKPRAGRSQTRSPRHIPAQVKRAAWERDCGQCTFVGEGGHRCEARKFLEFDHVDPVARGGQASVDGIRLLCRAHNQYAAERTFGRGFMDEKRQAARALAAEKARVAAGARAASKARAATEAAARAEAQAVKQAREAAAREVIPYLRALGSRADEARRAAASCEDMPDAPLESRVRAALAYFVPRGTRVERPEIRPANAT